MVVFVCNHCGDSVKKAAVEKHYMWNCRFKSKNLSCMDCMKDFRNQEYDSHTQCISEAEKYSGGNFVPKERRTKHYVHDSWMGILNHVLQFNYHLPQSIKTKVESLRGFINIPQKKVKFHNYVTNCLGWSAKDAETIWCVLEVEVLRVKREIHLRKQLDQQAKAKNEAEKKKDDTTKGDTESSPSQTSKENKSSVEEGEAEASATKTGTGEEETEAQETGEGESKKGGEEKIETYILSDSFPWFASLMNYMDVAGPSLSMKKLMKQYIRDYKAYHLLDELNDDEAEWIERRVRKTIRRSGSYIVNDEDVVELTNLKILAL